MCVSHGLENMSLFGIHLNPQILTLHCPSIGFDGSLPIDSMQGLEIGSQHGSNYGPMDHMDMSGAPPPHFEGMDNSGMAPPPNQQNQDQNQMAAWFDTDL